MALKDFLYFGVGVIVCLVFIHHGRQLVRRPDQFKRFSPRQMTCLGWCLILWGALGLIGGTLLLIFGPTGDQTNGSADTQAANDGWALYSPPEQDFYVLAPANVEVEVREKEVGKFREYVFRRGEAYICVTIHTDRKGSLAGNSVEELKASPDILPGSLKEISLGDMPGVEFRTQGRIGESIFREYCATDNSRSISIHVAKDLAGGFAEDEIRKFLDTFNLLP